MACSHGLVSGVVESRLIELDQPSSSSGSPECHASLDYRYFGNLYQDFCEMPCPVCRISAGGLTDDIHAGAAIHYASRDFGAVHQNLDCGVLLVYDRGSVVGFCEEGRNDFVWRLQPRFHGLTES